MSGYEPPTTCPTCGQVSRIPATELSKLFRTYAQRRGLSQSQIARGIGRSPQTVGFVFMGRQGTKGPYLGLKKMGKGRPPIALAVKEFLEVPDEEFAQAVGKDLATLAMQSLIPTTNGTMNGTITTTTEGQ